ncbi:MAG TPA: ImmA/IrrE family metallo-endopeptidase [Polyangiaceae bacterium]|jgi:hypothetical protein|nr:ImmA/IrrE family metallo-endopeptidase [Polyangiaceae bacterium]
MSVAAIAQRATAAALRLRADNGRDLSMPLCPYDLALDIGIEVRFEPIPSLEGIYRAGPSPVIILGSLRSRGRKAYSCAHELGHHALGHGTRVDELLDGASARFDPDEYAADRFASALLMPKSAVDAAFARRGSGVATARPEEVFAVAGYLGVGYTTLVGYLERTLGTLPGPRAAELRRHSPKSLRQRLFRDGHDGGVLVVDEAWRNRPIDAEVGDVILAKNLGAVRGDCLAPEGRDVVRAVRAGEGTIDVGASSAAVRVSRKEYRGLAEYRHLEDPDDSRP